MVFLFTWFETTMPELPQLPCSKRKQQVKTWCAYAKISPIIPDITQLIVTGTSKIDGWYGRGRVGGSQTFTRGGADTCVKPFVGRWFGRGCPANSFEMLVYRFAEQRCEVEIGINRI